MTRGGSKIYGLDSLQTLRLLLMIVIGMVRYFVRNCFEKLNAGTTNSGLISKSIIIESIQTGRSSKSRTQQ